MESTEPITIPIKLSKETKNTYRYDAVEEDAAVSNLYIQKTALPGGAPPELEINHQFPVRMQQQVGKLKKGGNSYFYCPCGRPGLPNPDSYHHP